MTFRWIRVAITLSIVIGGTCVLFSIDAAQDLNKCRANEKKISIALRIWKLNHNSFPAKLSQLVPSCITAIPICPSAERDTYSAAYSASEHGNYKFCCQGHYHSNENFPQYDGVTGLSEAPEVYILRLPPEQRTLNRSDIEYGRSQVDRMMNDRPAMAHLVKPGDVVYEWTARRFGGLSCGQRIEWFSGAFTVNFRAINQPPGQGKSGFISIRETFNNHKLSPQELWCSAVYELYNISNGPFWAEHANLARLGLLSRHTFIQAGSRLEYLSERKTQYFYENVWLPFSVQKRFSVETSSWRADTPSTFTGWKKRYWGTSQEEYPFNNFGARYDALVREARTQDRGSQFVRK